MDLVEVVEAAVVVTTSDDKLAVGSRICRRVKEVNKNNEEIAWNH